MLIFRYKKTTFVFVVLAAIALLQVIFAHTANYVHLKYNLGQTYSWMLVSCLAATYIATSFFSLRAYASVRYYSDSIAGSVEWGAFRNLYQSLIVFSVVIALTQILSSLMLIARAHNFSFTSHFVQVSDYTQVYLGFIVAVLLYMCSVKLLSVSRKSLDRSHMIVNLIFMAFSAVYTFMFFHHSVSSQSVSDSLLTIISPTSLNEPDWLKLITLTIPRLAFWYLSCIAILNLFKFQQKTEGKLYRRAFQTIPVGWLVIILSTMLYRITQATFLFQLNMRLGLLVICGITVGYAAMVLTGAILVARGVKKLQAIENL